MWLYELSLARWPHVGLFTSRTLRLRTRQQKINFSCSLRWETSCSVATISSFYAENLRDAKETKHLIKQVSNRDASTESSNKRKDDHQNQSRDNQSYKRRKFNRPRDSGSQNSKTDRYSDSRRKGSNQNQSGVLSPQVNLTLLPVMNLMENQVHTQVGCRLTQFVDRWSEITKDEWILDVVQEGLQLNFQIPPRMSGTRVTCTQNNVQSQCLLEEVESLLGNSL